MKNRNIRAQDTSGDYYIDGNTIRRIETAPDYRRERRERIEREREEEQKRKRRRARRNQANAMRESKSYVAFLTMAVLVFGTVAGMYIAVQSDITARMAAITKLESQIADLKADNDEAYKRIRTAVDLEQVRDAAINQMGMSYVKESQIIYYTVGEDDYMTQHGEIPKR